MKISVENVDSERTASCHSQRKVIEHLLVYFTPYDLSAEFVST